MALQRHKSLDMSLAAGARETAAVGEAGAEAGVEATALGTASNFKPEAE